ncbi:C40 family peptidase [Cohnella candidum]|uniref:C40 family peptidase n=1 Tax=Cohnella candidum TaxID=2674991 RepID=UPI001F153ECD|nr:C40 family peptidase [Cohnella candidum]
MTAFSTLLRPVIRAGLLASVGLAAFGFGHADRADAAAVRIIKLSAVAETLNPGEQVIASGNRYLGVPYRFGAPSGITSAFDCSSFTQFLYKQIGITLPRTTTEQASLGIPITKQNLKIGDLVFFKDPGRAQSIGHVAVYAGDNKILHSATGGVKYSDLDSSYYVKYYVTARRVL